MVAWWNLYPGSSDPRMARRSGSVVRVCDLVGDAKLVMELRYRMFGCKLQSCQDQQGKYRGLIRRMRWTLLVYNIRSYMSQPQSLADCLFPQEKADEIRVDRRRLIRHTLEQNNVDCSISWNKY